MRDFKAVITADILNSTQFAADISGTWLDELISLLKTQEGINWALPPEIYRGDSFQGVLDIPEEVLKVAILARTFLKSRKTTYYVTASNDKKIFAERSEIYAGKEIRVPLPIPKENTEIDIRIAVGIGTVDRMTNRPGTSDGEAFRLSGNLADEIKQHKARIGIALPTPTDSLSAILDLLETLISTWSAPQCEVILGILTNESVSTLATQLNISRSAVSQRLKTSNWWAAERIIQTFPELIKRYIQA